MEQYEDQWFINEKYFIDDLWIFLHLHFRIYVAGLLLYYISNIISRTYT